MGPGPCIGNRGIYLTPVNPSCRELGYWSRGDTPILVFPFIGRRPIVRGKDFAGSVYSSREPIFQ